MSWAETPASLGNPEGDDAHYGAACSDAMIGIQACLGRLKPAWAWERLRAVRRWELVQSEALSGRKRR
ncbi:hypothetical protein [Lysobacter gummosus]|uniref:hypothetical protein n=1 Tax=Lysobacter gummosus TaxID=262324 RepID=UPI003635F750